MIYKLRFDRNKYLVFELPTEELKNKLGKTYFLSLKKESWKSFWEEIQAEFLDESERGHKPGLPDITCWFTDQLVLSEHAYQSLKGLLEPYGEFLPVQYSGQPYWVFHITELTGMDVIDETKSARNIDESGFIDVDKLSFQEDKVSGLLVFKTEFNGYKSVYCTQQFKDAVESKGLRGLEFETDLVSIF